MSCSSLQYPRTDRMGCDALRPASPARPGSPSVSSNGSNGLRRVWGRGCPPPTCPSVSSNGSNGLRQQVSILETIFAESFSILERIEWAATHLLLRPPPLPLLLQYPRTDRMGCDARYRPRTATVLDPFSILERIEWAATSWKWFYDLRRAAPSVSSNGSNGLRHSTPSCHSASLCCFQYPRTDRMGCDQSLSRPGVTESVSFSILERIEWAATTTGSSSRPRRGRLQYPRTDRMGCDFNVLKRAAVIHDPSVSSNGSNGLRQPLCHAEHAVERGLQYPRTDRMGCDS